jgi:hypothetical protein
MTPTIVELLEKAAIRHDSPSHPGIECFGCKWESEARDIILGLQGGLSAALMGQPENKLHLLNLAYEEAARIVLGHKSHWQESFDKVQRDQLCDDMAAHIRSLKQ